MSVTRLGDGMHPAKGLAAVPAFGVCQAAGGSTVGCQSVMHVRQYAASGGAGVVIAGPPGVPNGGYGSAGYHHDIQALCETAVTGDFVGPVAGSWELKKTAPMKLFVVVRHNGDGTAHVNRIDNIGAVGDFGFARLYSTLADTDAVAYVKEYSPIQGTATPGAAPAEVANTNDLEGSTDDVVIVTLTGSGWVLAAVLEFSDAEHGFCRPYEDFDSGDATIRPAGYQKVEGIEAPDAGTTSVTNPGFSATTGDTLAVAKRSGVWTVCYVIRGGDDQLRHGIAALTADMATSDPTGSLTGATALHGSNPTLTAADNTEGLEGFAGQFVLIREIATDDWAIVAVLPYGATPHGIATLTTALTGSSASVDNWRQESGANVGTPTTVSNPGSFVAAVGIDVDIAWNGSAWVVLDVRGSGIALAALNGSLGSGDASATIDTFRWLQGNTESPVPTSALNTYGIDGADNDVVLLTNRSGAWTVAYRFGAANSGGVTPCWITTAAIAAPESGGDITAQEVTVYLDTLGATAADRVAGTSPLTAYWDNPDDPINITSGKARRGMVALTTLGTLDVLWASCDERTFTP